MRSRSGPSANPHGEVGRHKRKTEHMAEIIKQYGLSQAAISTALGRSMGVERQEFAGQGYRLVQNDCVEEIQGCRTTART